MAIRLSWWPTMIEETPGINCAGDGRQRECPVTAETAIGSSGRRRSGIALLMVLMIVMTIAVISVGFIARTDMQLACGVNVDVRTQADHLANSALEHARGLLLHPQDASTPYWQGDQRLQLLGTSRDYYDVTVARDESDPNDYCTYDITCEAYRLKSENGVEKKVGSTRLSASLRLDPSIGLWTKTDTTFRQNWVLHGDMRTQGGITNQAAVASIDGDVFTTQLVPVNACGGQTRAFEDVSLASLGWPPVTADYLNFDHYPPTSIPATLSGNPGPARVWRRDGDLVLGANAAVQGMLLVTGNLTVSGSGSRITAIKNLPALYVGGDLLLEDADDLRIEGLAVVEGNLRIRSEAEGVEFLGGLCLGGAITETTSDASGNGNRGILMKGPRWATDGSRNALEFDGTDDYVEIAHHPCLCVTTGVTVMAWIKTPRYAEPGQTYQGILAKSNDPRSYSFYTTSAGKLHFSTGPSPYLGSISGQTVPLDEWVHVCAMARDGVHRFFINGAPAGEGNSGVTLPGESDTAPVVIGNTWQPVRAFAGLIDDVRIYNRGLADEEVVHAANRLPVSSGLAGHWELDGPGSNVTITADPIKAAIVAYIDGMPRYWSPVAGAFFRRIERQPGLP